MNYLLNRGRSQARRSQSQICSAIVQAASRLNGDAHSDEYIKCFVVGARDASSLRAKFLVQPVTAVVASPNLSTHKPAGNCASRNDDRM